MPPPILTTPTGEGGGQGKKRRQEQRMRNRDRDRTRERQTEKDRNKKKRHKLKDLLFTKLHAQLKKKNLDIGQESDEMCSRILYSRYITLSKYVNHSDRPLID